MDAGQDVVGGLCPAEWSWIGIGGLDVSCDGLFEIGTGRHSLIRASPIAQFPLSVLALKSAVQSLLEHAAAAWLSVAAIDPARRGTAPGANSCQPVSIASAVIDGAEPGTGHPRGRSALSTFQRSGSLSREEIKQDDARQEYERIISEAARPRPRVAAAWDHYRDRGLPRLEQAGRQPASPAAARAPPAATPPRRRAPR